MSRPTLLVLTPLLLLLAACGPSRLNDADLMRTCELQATCAGAPDTASCVTALRAERDAANELGCGGQLGALARCYVRGDMCTVPIDCQDEAERYTACVTPDRDAGPVRGDDASTPSGALTARQTQGVLEVAVDGEWRSVCDDGFDEFDARVACRMLGFSEVVAYDTAQSCAVDSFWLDDLECTGTESSFAACAHAGWGVDNCGSTECLRVDCR